MPPRPFHYSEENKENSIQTEHRPFKRLIFGVFYYGVVNDMISIADIQSVTMEIYFQVLYFRSVLGCLVALKT